MGVVNHLSQTLLFVSFFVLMSVLHHPADVHVSFEDIFSDHFLCFHIFFFD